MPGIKELKTRIKSIQSTRKITRAMQLVSAAKMRKAQNSALNSRTYSGLVGELVKDLTGDSSAVIPTEPSASEGEWRDPLISEETSLSDSSTRMHSLGMTQLLQTYPQATKTGIIIISTNKGLVGGLNSNLMSKIREVETSMADGTNRTDKTDTTNMSHQSNSSYTPIAELLVMGRKAKDYAVRFNKNMMADFAKSDSWVGIESIYPLAKMVTELYQSGQYKKIVIVYNQFVSTLTQRPMVKQLLPFGDPSDGSVPIHRRSETEPPINGHATNPSDSDYIFEPSADHVLEHLLPRIIESQIYQAVLESDASEHSARMVMMKNATEAAGDLISDLTLTYNQLRQNKITTELSEITAGRIALE